MADDRLSTVCSLTLDQTCTAYDSYLGWGSQGTDKLRFKPFPGLSCSLLWLNGAFLCVEVPI